MVHEVITTILLSLKQTPIFWKTSSLEYNGAVVWNSIPIEIRNSTSLKIFKNKL
jgi:hypothetical protein